MTKQEFINTYRAALEVRFEWAKEVRKLDNFMASVENTLDKKTGVPQWNWDGPTTHEVWKAAGLKGKPTKKALQNLPAI